MGVGTVATDPGQAAYVHLLDPRKKWYNNRRCVPMYVSQSFADGWTFVRLIALNAWIVLLQVLSYRITLV
jgi:hypothetical protein